jgi:hypothetical protein
MVQLNIENGSGVHTNILGNGVITKFLKVI